MALIISDPTPIKEAFSDSLRQVDGPDSATVACATEDENEDADDKDEDNVDDSDSDEEDSCAEDRKEKLAACSLCINVG